MTAANSIDQQQQKEQNENIEKYMDIITGDFTYDPVRLPIDQDPTQSIYNRKTLETIWETTHKASNPFSRQWFHIKSVIPQADFRVEMQQHLKNNQFSVDSAEFDVIPEYTKILEKPQMEQHLNMICDGVTDSLRLEKQYWEKMWKKINLLRLYSQYHDENIQTFRDLNGFRYLHKLNVRTLKLLIDIKRNDEKREIKEAALEVCKEIVRTVDIIGLRSSDIGGENSMGESQFACLLQIFATAYKSSKGYPKFQSIVLRLICALDDNSVQVDPTSHSSLTTLARLLAMDKLSNFRATEISSEDLNYGISILRRAGLNLLDDNHVKAIVKAINMTIARATQTPDTCRLSELQILEAQEQERHNLEALENGLLIINGILNEDRPFADAIKSLDIVSDKFKHLKLIMCLNINDVNKHRTDCQSVCNTAQCVHIKIAVLASNIRVAMSKSKRKLRNSKA